MADLTLTCSKRQCHSTNFVTTLNSTHHSNPSACPLCTTKVLQARSTDMADFLSYTYMGVTRQLALALLSKLDNFNSNRASHSQLTLEQLVERSGTYLVQYPPSAYTPLTVICNDCASSYRVLRGQPNTLAAGQPKFCIWCGSQHITISTVTDEAAAWELLSQKYQLPIPQLVKVYEVWQQHGYYQHFHDFMIAPNNQDQLDTLRLAAELNNSTQGVITNVG